MGRRKYLTYCQLQSAVELGDDWSTISGFQQTIHILNNGNFPTVMLVANDQMALDAVRTISGFGLRATVDISVIGYDDTKDSACYIPPLTAIKQDSSLLGEANVDRLLQFPRDESTVGNQLLPVTLAKRKTVLPPDTQTTTPQALADSLIQSTQQVSQFTPKL